MHMIHGGRPEALAHPSYGMDTLLVQGSHCDMNAIGDMVAKSQVANLSFKPMHL